MPPSRKKEPKTQASNDVLSSPVAISAMVVGVCVVAVLFSLVTNTDQTNPSLNNFLRDLGVKRRKVDILCASGYRESSANGCKMVTRSDVNRGETILKIPQKAMIDQKTLVESDYAPLFQYNNGSMVEKFLQENTVNNGYGMMVYYAYYLAMQKQLGSYSKWYPWIQSLPTTFQSGMFWDEELDQCTDAISGGEAKVLRRLLNATVHIVDALCEIEELKGACSKGRPTKDELQWGFGVYFSRHLNHQAIIVGLDFVNHHSDVNLVINWNQQEEVLDVAIGAPTLKGGEVLNNYQAGVPTLMTTHGFFDRSTSIYPANIATMNPNENPLYRRYNCDKRFELSFTNAGRPRKALVNCLGLIVSGEQKDARFKEAMKHPKILMYVYGNLTMIAQQQMNGLPSEDTDVCKGNDYTRNEMRAASEFGRIVLDKNVAYLREQYMKYSTEWSKIAPPEEITASDSAGDAPIEGEATEEAAQPDE